MCVAPVPPGSDGARFHRAIDAPEFHNPFARDLPERHQAWWPRANGNHERDERFANGRLEAGSYSDADDDENRRPSLPTPKAARAANGHKPAE
jgi:hypothetical protein